MKIAVTSSGPSLEDMVETGFARCAYFLIIDIDTMEMEALPNPNRTTNEGAGIQPVQRLAKKNVSVLLTGNCGPNASRAFSSAGIRVMTKVRGPVRQAVQNYLLKYQCTPYQLLLLNIPYRIIKDVSKKRHRYRIKK